MTGTNMSLSVTQGSQPITVLRSLTAGVDGTSKTGHTVQIGRDTLEKYLGSNGADNFMNSSRSTTVPPAIRNVVEKMLKTQAVASTQPTNGSPAASTPQAEQQSMPQDLFSILAEFFAKIKAANAMETQAQTATPGNEPVAQPKKKKRGFFKKLKNFGKKILSKASNIMSSPLGRLLSFAFPPLRGVSTALSMASSLFGSKPEGGGSSFTQALTNLLNPGGMFSKLGGLLGGSAPNIFKTT